MESLQQRPIYGKFNNETTRIDLNSWSFLAKGMGHIILQNDIPNDRFYSKVIIICIHEVGTIDKDFQLMYFQIIHNAPIIKNYLLKRELFELEAKSREQLKSFVKDKLKIKIEIPNNFMVHIAKNLNRCEQGWEYTLQFKPKTALADKYSNKFIGNLKEKLCIQCQDLEKTLNNRPLEEKTRWFKKNALKAIKKNINPLQIFGIFTESYPRFIDKLKNIQGNIKQRQWTTEENNILNTNIMQKLKQSQILTQIGKIQLLFAVPSDTIQTQFSQIQIKQQDKPQFLAYNKQKITKYLNSDVNVNEKIEHLLSTSLIQQIKSIQNDKQSLQYMFRALISRSWRDISLIIRIKINQESLNIEDIDITIIDYELKQSSKLKETLKKDEEYLINYLKFLQIV